MSPPTRNDPEAALTEAESAAEVVIEGRSAAISAFRYVLLEAARADVPVLLLGEAGTGKTTFAHAMHVLSARAERPFVRVDCRERADDLAEQFRIARTGTLFLDDVAELSPDAQAAALALVQDAGAVQKHAAARVVASARPDLEGKVAARRFRPDLFYRLSVFEVRIPPLRERREDIVPLAQRFLELAARREGRAPPELPLDLVRVLLAYRWPGNVTELMSAVERTLILAPGNVLQASALPERMRS